VPSRSKILTRAHARDQGSTGNAPAERISACSIGGMSGNDSLTAI
jgi:hypothetical protein